MVPPARRHVVVAVVAVLAAVGGASVGSTLAEDREATSDAPRASRWERLPDLPVAARSDPVVGWTGDEVLVVGGHTQVCPRNALCRDLEPARDGAAYDPEQRTWRRIAGAPVGMAEVASDVMVGDTLVVLVRERGWFAYDAGDDAWRRVPDPPQPVRPSARLSAGADGFAYVVSDVGQVLALKVAARRWAVVPDAFVPKARATAVFVTPKGFVLSGTWLDGSPDTAVAQVWDDADRKPISTGQVLPFQHWTGRRLVTLDLRVREHPDGTRTPYGGRLDVRTRTWSALPGAPSEPVRDDWLPVASDGELMAAAGHAYDDGDETWIRLGRPDGAVATSGLGAVWAKGRLLVLGGADPSSRPTKQVWAWVR